MLFAREEDPLKEILKHLGIKYVEGHILESAIMFGLAYREEHSDTGCRCIEVFFGLGAIGIHFI